MPDPTTDSLPDASSLGTQAEVKQITELLDNFADVLHQTNTIWSTLQIHAPHLIMKHFDHTKMTDLEARSMAKSFLADRIQQLIAMGTQLDVYVEDKVDSQVDDGSDVNKDTGRRYHAVVKVPTALADSSGLSVDDVAKGIEFWKGKSNAGSYARSGSSQRPPSTVHDDVINYCPGKIKDGDPTLAEDWVTGWSTDRAELMKRYNDTDGGHFEDWVNKTISTRREKAKAGPLAKLEKIRAKPKSLLFGSCEGDVVQSNETSLKPITMKNLRTWMKGSKKEQAKEEEALKIRIARRHEDDSSFNMSREEALEATAQRQKGVKHWRETLHSQKSVRDSLFHGLLTQEGASVTALDDLDLTPALYAFEQQILMLDREERAQKSGSGSDDLPLPLDEHQMAIVNAIASEDWDSAIALSQNHLTPGGYGAKWHDDTEDLPEEFRLNSHSYALSDRFGRDKRAWSGRFKIEAVDTIDKGAWTVQNLAALLRSEIPRASGDQFTVPPDSDAAAPRTVAESSASGDTELTPPSTALESEFSALGIETPTGSVAEGDRPHHAR